MRVSVALCTYRGERWLPELLRSLRDQDWLPDELIVSDDGSDDQTVAQVHRFAEDAPFPVELVVNPHRLGPTANFGRAFARCRGEVIAPADQDDVWTPRKLRVLVGELMEHDASVVFGDGVVIDATGAEQVGRLWSGVGFGARDRRRFAREPLGVLLRRSVVTGAAMAFRASVLALAAPFPGELAAPAGPMLHDRWIAMVAAMTGRVHAVDEAVIQYRSHPGQETGLRTPMSVVELGRHASGSQSDVSEASSARAAQFRALADRVAGEARPGSLARLEAAIAHLERRAALPSGRIGRVLPVLGELASGRYAAYSSRPRSAVADISRGP